LRHDASRYQKSCAISTLTTRDALDRGRHGAAAKCAASGSGDRARLRVQYDPRGDGPGRTIEQYRYDTNEGRRFVREAAKELGWRERRSSEQKIGIVFAVVGGVGALVTGIVLPVMSLAGDSWRRESPAARRQRQAPPMQNMPVGQLMSEVHPRTQTPVATSQTSPAAQGGHGDASVPASVPASTPASEATGTQRPSALHTMPDAHGPHVPLPPSVDASVPASLATGTHAPPMHASPDGHVPSGAHEIPASVPKGTQAPVAVSHTVPAAHGPHETPPSVDASVPASLATGTQAPPMHASPDGHVPSDAHDIPASLPTGTQAPVVVSHTVPAVHGPHETPPSVDASVAPSFPASVGSGWHVPSAAHTLPAAQSVSLVQPPSAAASVPASVPESVGVVPTHAPDEHVCPDGQSTSEAHAPASAISTGANSEKCATLATMTCRDGSYIAPGTGVQVP
jgi:hypothetical protein